MAPISELTSRKSSGNSRPASNSKSIQGSVEGRISQANRVRRNGQNAATPLEVARSSTTCSTAETEIASKKTPKDRVGVEAGVGPVFGSGPLFLSSHCPDTAAIKMAANVPTIECVQVKRPTRYAPGPNKSVRRSRSARVPARTTEKYNVHGFRGKNPRARTRDSSAWVAGSTARASDQRQSCC